MKYIWIILFVLWACQSPTTDKPVTTGEIPVLQIVSHNLENGVLMVKFSDGTEQEIPLDSGEAEVVVSPDEKKNRDKPATDVESEGERNLQSEQ